MSQLMGVRTGTITVLGENTTFTGGTNGDEAVVTYLGWRAVRGEAIQVVAPPPEAIQQFRTEALAEARATITLNAAFNGKAGVIVVRSDRTGPGGTLMYTVTGHTQ